MVQILVVLILLRALIRHDPSAMVLVHVFLDDTEIDKINDLFRYVLISLLVVVPQRAQLDRPRPRPVPEIG